MRDFFRFYGDAPSGTSLRSHGIGMDGPQLNVNMVIVAHEAFSLADFAAVDTAIQDVRDLYARAGVGVNAEGRLPCTSSSGQNPGLRPYRSSQANSICERLIGTLRRECPDRLIPTNEAHQPAVT